MPDIYQATRVIRVPLVAVVEGSDVITTPTVGRQIGDPWVHVGPGAKVDLSQWPADRVAPPRLRGKPPEKHEGAGNAAKEKLVSRECLVPVSVELPPDPPIQRTHPEKDIYREDGSVKTMGVRPSEEDEKPAKRAAKTAKKGGR